MNPDFKVLTNVGESNSRTPIIQNRFRKLTLQSPQPKNGQPKMPQHTTLPQSKLATENIVLNRSLIPARSQSQVITNKLMLSTSSNALTETNFINVETEPFTNPLQVESTQSAQKSPKNSDNGELTSQMEKLEVSRVSAELFSQYSSSSKISLPPNRVLSNKENIENLSQRMSNIRMSDLASTQPNTSSASKRQSNASLAETQPNTSSSANKRQSNASLADTQPNTAAHQTNRSGHSTHSSGDQRIIASIVLSSDDEDNNDKDKIMPNKSLLTEESDDDDDSVIEILSSDDESIHASNEHHVPQYKPALNAEIDELTESVAQKLNNFFDNIPNLDKSRQNFYEKTVESEASSIKETTDTSEIIIPETEPSNDRNHRDENNDVLELDVSQLDESVRVSGSKAESQIFSSNEKGENDKSATQNSFSDKPDDASPHNLRQPPVLQVNKSGRMPTVDSESENRSVEDGCDNADASCLNQSTDEKQLSVREPKKKVEFERIKMDAKKVIKLNSPIINVSATININIQVSGFSTSSSDTDVTSENADDPSEQSSRNDTENADDPSEQSSKNDVSEQGVDSSMELVTGCRMDAKHCSGSNSEKLIVYTLNNKETGEKLPNQDDQMTVDSNVIDSSIVANKIDVLPNQVNQMTLDSSVIESSIVYSPRCANVAKVNDELPNQEDPMSPDSSTTESVIINSQENAAMDNRSGEKDASGRLESNSSLASADVVTKESSDESASSADLLPKESVVDGTKKNEHTLSETPTDTSVEIDEFGELLLNCIYGDTWRTPQLVKKCLSTKKKFQTEVKKRDKSRGFSLFRHDVIHSDLDSTRITSTDAGTENCEEHPVQSHPESDPTLPTQDEEVKSDADQSSQIKPKRRRAAANRILDYSDESENDSNQSDSSFEPEPLEESDNSVEILEKPEPPRRKRKNVVFLDLTCNEVIEDEDHENPDATSEELEKVVEIYLQSLATETNIQTPAPVKKNVPTNTTRRKLFTPNYDDQSPFEELKTPELPVIQNDEKKTIQLKTPIPSYLIPPQFRDRPKVAEPFTPTSTNSKKIQTPYTPAPKIACGFLESLDSKLIPDEHCDPEALKFRSNFKRHRNELVTKLLSIYNKFVFDDKLIDVPVSWNKNLRTTGGYCRCRKIAGVRKASVDLSEKVLTSADRLRDTLIHELCHAANWIIDGGHGHGKVWKYWASRANKRFPQLPLIQRCHNYDIAGKYTYKCMICGLKSRAQTKSKKVENIRCAKCHGPIEIFLNKTDKDGQVILVPPKEPSMFAKYVKEKYKLHKVSGATHAEVMKMLSNNFAKLTVEEKTMYK